ncbi:5' nucleotidase, NT5C type [Rhodococcoides fascians]|uniref:5' nucleotidase, NT5C type n=1 Tax=Rhodococcoides fascians TaxID=1828 RepID=UPI00050C59C6|nr:hypothetical protein [Rhodococcus fascians]
MARIGIDLDGVLYPFGDVFRTFMVKHMHWPKDLCGEQTEWHFYEKWGLSAAGFKAMCDRAANENRLWSGAVLQNSDRVALGRLQAAGHTLHIITDRQFGAHPAISHSATANWLLANTVPYDTLTFSGDKTIVATDYMIDDKLENYDALYATGCEPYLLNQPWNADDEEEANSYVRRRVNTLGEFANTVINAEKETLAA